MEPINIENVRAISVKWTSSNKRSRKFNWNFNLFVLYGFQSDRKRNKWPRRKATRKKGGKTQRPLKSRIESMESVKRSKWEYVESVLYKKYTHAHMHTYKKHKKIKYSNNMVLRQFQCQELLNIVLLLYYIYVACSC